MIFVTNLVSLAMPASFHRGARRPARLGLRRCHRRNVTGQFSAPFKAQYGKTVPPSPPRRPSAFRIFSPRTWKGARRYNRREPATPSSGATVYADLSESEFKTRQTASARTARPLKAGDRQGQRQGTPVVLRLAPARRGSTPVKNQGSGGSCWSSRPPATRGQWFPSRQPAHVAL